MALSDMQNWRVSILGASGYTGAELVRIVSGHPELEIAGLSADRNAGKDFSEVFPAFRHLDLPRLQTADKLDFAGVDLVFCALPHSTSQSRIKSLPPHVKVVDLSADFRIRDPDVYERWYGVPHLAPDLQASAVYGLTEFYREDIRSARLVACTGCNSAAGLYALLPLLESGSIAPDGIIVDLKTGVSGAGRAPKESTLFSEVSEGLQAYNVAKHRHLAEFDQELSKAAGREVRITFTPHLAPQNRGILATSYVYGDASAVHEALAARYEQEPFLEVLPFGEHPSTRHVRGSNFVHIGVVKDRVEGRCILISALDNLTKGSAGQAVQNANLMLGLGETQGLTNSPFAP